MYAFFSLAISLYLHLTLDIAGRASPSMLAVGSLPSAQTSSLDMDNIEYERRIHQFNNTTQRSLVSPTGSRAISWSDTRAAELMFPQVEIGSNIRSASTSALPETVEEKQALFSHKPTSALDDLYTESRMYPKGRFVG